MSIYTHWISLSIFAIFVLISALHTFHSIVRISHFYQQNYPAGKLPRKYWQNSFSYKSLTKIHWHFCIYNTLTKRMSKSIFFPVLNSKGQEWEVGSNKMGCQVNYPNLLNTGEIFLGYSLVIIKCCRGYFSEKLQNDTLYRRLCDWKEE